MLVRVLTVLAGIVAVLAVFERPASGGDAAVVKPALEMRLDALEYILIGRLLWALGKVTEQDQPACDVSGPVYAPQWPAEYPLTERDTPCFEWRLRIDDALRQYDHSVWTVQDFSKTWDSLRTRVLQDANASWLLCRREGGEEWCANTVKLYKPLAEQENVKAQYRVGIAFSHMMPDSSINPQQNAIMWLRRAAERDYIEAEWELGNQYYMRGLGWQAEKGILGKDWDHIRQALHYPANGASQDLAEAVTWWRRAADGGHALSQWRLSAQYEEGEGVPQDYVQAYKWLTLAIQNIPSDQKHDWWAVHRQALAGKMTTQQIAEARRLVAEWLQQHPSVANK